MFDLKAIAESLLGAASGGNQSGLSPWAIRIEAVASSTQMIRMIRGRDSNSLPAAEMGLPLSRRGQPMGRGSFATRIGNIAVVPVMGPLVSRLNWQYWSYDEIVNDLRLIGEMPDIAGVVLDVDSPGGMVSNVDSVPEEITRLRKKKPVVAHVGGLGASAAYWVSSAAERVTADKTALVGSVGALIRYVDMEGILVRLGGNVVEAIASQSPNKRLSRDSEEGMAELQAIVDDGAEMFIESLMRNRGVSRETVLENYGQGFVFPAAEALQRGLIDEVASFESVVAALADRVNSNSIFASSAIATAEPNKEVTVLTLEKLKAEHPDLVTAIEEAAKTSALATVEQKVADAAQAERNRITGIEEQASGLSGHDELVKKLKADGKTTPAEAAVQILAAQKAKLANMQAGLEGLDLAASGVESSLSGGTDAAAQVPQTAEGWKAEWQSSTKLQAEYPTAEAYVAVKKREKRA